MRAKASQGEQEKVKEPLREPEKTIKQSRKIQRESHREPTSESRKESQREPRTKVLDAQEPKKMKICITHFILFCIKGPVSTNKNICTSLTVRPLSPATFPYVMTTENWRGQPPVSQGQQDGMDVAGLPTAIEESI